MIDALFDLSEYKNKIKVKGGVFDPSWDDPAFLEGLPKQEQPQQLQVMCPHSGEIWYFLGSRAVEILELEPQNNLIKIKNVELGFTSWTHWPHLTPEPVLHCIGSELRILYWLHRNMSVEDIAIRISTPVEELEPRLEYLCDREFLVKESGKWKVNLSGQPDYLKALVAFPKLLDSLEDLIGASQLRLTQTVADSCDTISTTRSGKEILKTGNHSLKSTTSYVEAFPAQEHQPREKEKDLTTQNQHFLENSCVASAKPDLHLLSLNNPWELSIADLEQSLADSDWQAIKLQIASSLGQIALERRTTGKDYLYFPTPTSSAGVMNRPSGWTKYEKWFSEKGIVPSGLQLSARAMSLCQGFPVTWLDPICFYRPKHPEESAQESQPEQQLHHRKQPSPLIGSDGLTKIQLSKQTGSLYKYVCDRKDKNGIIRTYPIVNDCDRDPVNDKHWYHGLSYEYQDSEGQRRSKSVSVPRGKLELIRLSISQNSPIADTLQLLGKFI